MALRLVFAVLIAAALVLTLVYRSWVRAQGRAVIVLSITQKTPVLAWTARLATSTPRIAETTVAGVPATVVRPGDGHGPWPAIVFVNGATRRGRHHPKVERLARGLARAGFLAVVPDPPGLRLGELTPTTIAATVRVALATAARSDAHGSRVGLYGVSVGTSLALLAAEDPRLAGRVIVVGGEAPYTDMRKIIRLATTGFYGSQRYATDPYAALAIGRSLAAGLPRGRDRLRLLGRLEARADNDQKPLAGLRVAGLGPRGRALVRLLENRDPARFNGLYANLPRALRGAAGLLSPLPRAGRLRAPVELASAPHDKYFPTAESRALVRRAARARLTVTSTLEHAVPKPSLGDVADLIRFDGFIVRFLHAAARA